MSIITIDTSSTNIKVEELLTVLGIPFSMEEPLTKKEPTKNEPSKNEPSSEVGELEKLLEAKIKRLEQAKANEASNLESKESSKECIVQEFKPSLPSTFSDKDRNTRNNTVQSIKILSKDGKSYLQVTMQEALGVGQWQSYLRNILLDKLVLPPDVTPIAISSVSNQANISTLTEIPYACPGGHIKDNIAYLSKNKGPSTTLLLLYSGIIPSLNLSGVYTRIA